MSDETIALGPPRGELDSNRVQTWVAVGPLAGPMLCRVVSILAARADCPLNRLDDALLVCDLIAAHAPGHLSSPRVGVAVDARPDRLALTVGPLVADGAQALLSDAAVPGLGNVLEQVADDLSVQSLNGGHQEMLLIELGF